MDFGGGGALYCEPFFRKCWIYAITLESSLAVSVEAENAPMLPVFPYKRTCTGCSKQQCYAGEKWEIIQMSIKSRIEKVKQLINMMEYYSADKRNE